MKNGFINIIPSIFKRFGFTPSMRLLWRMSYSLRNGYRGDKKIDTIYLQLTTSCNLSCKGCYAKEQRTNSARVFTEKNDVLIDYILSIRNIVVLGGEPLLRDCRTFLLNILKRHKGSITIVTNMTMLDEEIVSAIIKNGRVTIMISIDGDEHYHDLRRGEGVFKLVDHNINILRKEKIFYGIICTVTETNYDYVLSDGFVDLCIRLGSFFTLYLPFTSFGCDSVELSLSEKRYQQMLDRIKDLNRRISHYAIYHGVEHEINSSYGGCRAGDRGLYIKADGCITPCPAIDMDYICIEENDSEADIIEKSQAFSGFRDIKSKCFGKCPIIYNKQMLDNYVSSLR